MNQSEQKTVTIIGLGFIGFPTLLAIAGTKKYRTCGLDIDKKRINDIRRKYTDAGTEFSLTHDPAVCIPDSDIAIICVPTSLYKNNTPDTHHVSEAIRTLLLFRKKKIHVIMESTLPPGECANVLLPIFQRKHLALGKDFELSYCPERFNPGDDVWPLEKIPRVVSSMTLAGQREALALYRSFITEATCSVTSIQEAEIVKLVENIFRDVNIALVNTLAVYCTKHNLNITRILTAAGTKPFSFLSHQPGTGVGGECIPTAAHYLNVLTDNRLPDLLMSARAMNNSMPSYTVRLLEQASKEINVPLSKLSVGILGLSYKPNINDTRRSPAWNIIGQIKKQANLHVFDPFVPDHSTVDSLGELLQVTDAIVLATAHSLFIQKVTGKNLHKNAIRIVVDGRNCLNDSDIRSFGIVYKGIGR